MSGISFKLLCHTSIPLSCLFLLLMSSCCSGTGHNVTPAGNKASVHSSNTNKHSNMTALPRISNTTSGCDNNSSTCHNQTNTQTSRYHDLISQIQDKKGMLLRTLYVLIGVTTVVAIYFVIKAVRLRRRRSKSKKYGIITTPASDLEMAPLDQGDDDDEDMTVFEMNGKPK